MRRPRLRGMVVSITLHAIALGLAVILLQEPAPPPLFIDLTRPLETAGVDSAAASPRSAPAPPAPAPGARRRPAGREHARSRVVRQPAREPSAAPAATSAPSVASAPSAPAVPPPAEAAGPSAPVPADVAASPLPVPASPAPPSAPPAAPPASTGDAVATGAGTFAVGSEAGVPSTSPPSHGLASSGAASPAAGNGGAGGDAFGAGQRGAGTTALAVPGDGGRAGGDYAAYLALVRRRIQESLRYPMAARRRGLTGSVHVEITVEPSGRIADVSLVTSSTHALLDEAALEAVRALPRVPFPPDVTPRSLRVRLPVVFELR